MLCGAETFEIAKAVVSLWAPSKVAFAKLAAALGAHYEPKPSEIYSRCKFQQREQLLGESLSNYVAALKHLAADCNFGVTATLAVRTAEHSGDYTAAAEHVQLSVLIRSTFLRDIMLHDRFVCGISDGMLQQCLFAERDLTFQKDFNIGVGGESAAMQQRSLKTGMGLADVHQA